MEKNVDEAAIERNAARGAMRAERAARREAMAVVAKKGYMGGRTAKRCQAVLIDEEAFNDWMIERAGPGDEAGRDDRFMSWFCAQIASGVTATVLCDHYNVGLGLLGAYLTEVPERLERYRRAQAWAADGLVDEAYEEAWDDGPDVVRAGLRVKTNMAIAGKWNRAMYGEEKQKGSMVAPTINFILPAAAPAPAEAPAIEAEFGEAK